MTMMLASVHLAWCMAAAAADPTSVQAATLWAASTPMPTVGFPIMHQPDDRLTVPVKVVGGTARSHYTGNGNLLTQTQPSVPDRNRWIATSKNHFFPHVTKLRAYAFGQVDLSADWEAGPASWLCAVLRPNRPFRILAVGDSVMWGQGLRDESKFKTKVAQWVQRRLNHRVDVTLLARSGAEIGPMSQPSPQPTPSAGEGEVPNSLPYIRHQALVLAPKIVAPAQVDLILIDGGINDVGVRNILDPGISDEEIADETTASCGTAMQQLLTDVAKMYPNSKIVVTGYFPIVTDNSDLTAVTILASHLGAISAAAAPLFGIPLDPVTGTIAGVVTSKVLKDKFVAHSAVFHVQSTNALLGAVTKANQSVGGNRIDYVDPAWGPGNSYAAGPDTWLWLVPTPPVVDEVYDERFESCQSVTTGVDNVLCVEASMGHPNPKGAQAYADAITNLLEKYTMEWSNKFTISK